MSTRTIGFIAAAARLAPGCSDEAAGGDAVTGGVEAALGYPPP